MSPAPRIGTGLGWWIERRARFAGDRPALLWRSETRTYGELAARVRRLGVGLARLGVRPGDRVAWLGPNHPAFLEALFATARIGAILAPVNHRLPDAERAWVLGDVEPSVVIRHRAVPDGPLPPSVRERVLAGDDEPGGAEAGIDVEALIAGSGEDVPEREISLDDLVLLPHTSGTTGHPKGVMLTHGNVTWNVVNLLSIVDLRSDDVTAAIAPFFRVGGTGVNVLPVLFLGGTVVIPDTSDGPETLRVMEAHRVTVGFANPDLLAAMAAADRWPAADLSALRYVLTGGAPVPDALIRDFHARGIPLVQGYGLSEASPVALILDAEQARTKPGSAGRPPVLVDVRIARADGSAVDAGETGELLVRGPNVMTGYWRRPDATATVLTGDGWLRTGDAAWIDADGDAWIVDRISAAFEVAGRTVYPGDVERVLLEHPAVADVAVLPSAVDGTVVPVALVVRAPGSGLSSGQEILELAAARLAPHQVPARVWFVDEVPRSSVGKLVREALPAMLAAAAG